MLDLFTYLVVCLQDKMNQMLPAVWYHIIKCYSTLACQQCHIGADL